MSGKNLEVNGYLVFLYNLVKGYEIHIKLKGEQCQPTPKEVDGIINYLKDEGFIKPPKSVHALILNFR